MCYQAYNGFLGTDLVLKSLNPEFEYSLALHHTTSYVDY